MWEEIETKYNLTLTHEARNTFLDDIGEIIDKDAEREAFLTNHKLLQDREFIWMKVHPALDLTFPYLLTMSCRGVQTIRRPFDYEAFRLLFRESSLKLFLNISDYMKFDIFYLTETRERNGEKL